MKTKAEIVKDWLPRYTGRPLETFGKYILLSNFVNYVELFAERFGVEVLGRDRPMQSATAEDLTILNFGMGVAMAATVMDLLSAVEPKAVLFLGKCGGLKKTKVGDFILPIAAIRGEGTSNDYMPAGDPRPAVVPPAEGGLGHDRQARPRLLDGDGLHDQPAGLGARREVQGVPQGDPGLGIDMETATIFIVGFVNHIPKGALLLVSDSPMTPEGVKTVAERQGGDREVRPQAPGDRHRLADRAPRLGRVGQAPAVRVNVGRVSNPTDLAAEPVPRPGEGARG